LGCTITPHCRLDRHRSAQRLDRILGPDFLDKVERHADQDDGPDDEKARDISGNGRQSARREQDEHQRIAKAGQKLQPKWRTCGGRSGVVAMDGRPRRHLRGIETRRVGRESLKKPAYRFLPDLFGADLVAGGNHTVILTRQSIP
jgi:hypothetical protein